MDPVAVEEPGGEGQTLGLGIIAKIRSHNDVTPINQRLLVYS